MEAGYFFKTFFKNFLGDEEDSWSKKAIDILMKKLQKHNKQSLALLEHALKTEGKEPTECVTIPRSIDGRIQILVGIEKLAISTFTYTWD